MKTSSILPAILGLLLATPTFAGPSQPGTSPDQMPEGLEKSDWQSIRAAHEGWKHRFHAVDGGWQANNPGQQWTARFDGRGFVATPKDAKWTWGLEFQSYGFGENLAEISGTPEIRAGEQRLSYHWNDNVEEWFLNDQRGLEHGFIVKQRPEGGKDREGLIFTIGTVGSLKPTVSADAQIVHFGEAASAPVLNYSGLKVWDADGTVLPSRFESGIEGAFRLVVEEGEARYPITIDPIAQQAFLKSGNNGPDSFDWFGYAVSVSGETVVVGAPQENSSSAGVNSTPNNDAIYAGAAYVFVRSGTTWSQQAYLKASNPGAGFRFGWSVSIDGNTVAVGTPYEASSTTGVNSTPNTSASVSGAAYVFVRSGTTWSQQAYVKAGNAEAFDQFGYSVSASGDTLIVGAPYEDSSTTGINSTPNNSSGLSGASYVFVRSGTAWSQQAYLKASNTGSLDEFGYSVSVSGDTAVIGAHFEDSSATGVDGTQSNNSSSASGAAYVFARSGVTWSQQAYLKASNSQANDEFAKSVSVSGNTVVIGAWFEDSGTTGVNSTPNESANKAGAAYVFIRSGTTWSQQAYLKASNTGSGDEFGQAVSISGDTLVVAAMREDSVTTGVNSAPNDALGAFYESGATYVFVRSGTTWSQQAYLKASNTGEEDNFGHAVGVSGDLVVVGALLEDSSTTGVNSTSNEGAMNAGAAYLYVRSGTTWSHQAYLKASNTPSGSGANDQFGWSVAVSGNTVVVGAPNEDSGTSGVNSAPNEARGSSGAVYVFVRSGIAWTQQAYLKASNTGATDFFGESVSVSGDTLVVGASYEDSSTTGINSTPNDSVIDAGAAYVFVRSGTTWSQQAYLKPGNTGAEDYFGGAVSISGNTLAIGARHEDSSTTGVNTTSNEAASSSGAVYMFVRSGTTWTQQAYLKAGNADAGDFFGEAVSVSGDTLIVGASNEESGTTGVNSIPNENANGAGAAYVFVRSGTTWSQQAYLKSSNTQEFDGFGGSVSADLDTVVVGASFEDSSTTGVNSSPNESASASGAAYVFTRSGTTWIQQAYLKASNTQLNDAFGRSVSVSGNTLIVGAPGEDSSTIGVNGNPNEGASAAGAAYLFARNGTTWSQLAYLKASNTGAGDAFGSSVTISGLTAVVGAVGEDSSTTGVGSTPNELASDSGAAYVFDDFTPPPSVASVSPSVGSISGGTNITINGAWFTGATAVTIGGVAVSGFSVISDTSITATTSARAAGVVDVVVTTPVGTGTGIGLFSYAAADIAVAQASPLVDGSGLVPFGSVVAGSGNQTLTFTISNPGLISLTDLAVSKSGANANDFTVSELNAVSIPVGTGTTTFTVTFSPSSSGGKSAVLQITSNVIGAKNPFDIAVSGQGVTAQAAANAAITAAGLTGEDALPSATPFNDGVNNQLKYAFNMNLAGPDSATMEEGGTSGLPIITPPESGPAAIFRYEFLRRVGSGLIYTPQKNSSLDPTGWTTLTDAPTITPIGTDGLWERVIYEEPVDPEVVSKCYGRVEVTIP